MEQKISRGCNCINTFTIPFPEEDIECLYITYKQDKETVFEKTLQDCTFEEGIISVELTQEDTLKLCEYCTIEIQIRLKLVNGRTTKSKIVKTTTDSVLKDEVI